MNPTGLRDNELKYFKKYFEYDSINLKHIKNRKVASGTQRTGRREK